MGRLFYQGGVFMWPLLLLAVVNVILSVRKIVELFRVPASGESRSDAGINAILFWGCISLVMGFLGHYLGVYGASGAIARAGDIKFSILAGGYQVSLITIIFGMLTFLFSAMMWFFLRWRYQKRAMSG